MISLSGNSGAPHPQGQRSATAIRQALHRVLDEPGFGHAARNLAAATAALPSEQFAARLLEQLARTRRPVTRGTTPPQA